MTEPVAPNRSSFLGELKRRRVFRVSGVYIVATFAFIQAAELIFPRVGMPDWTVTAAVVVALLGFPVAAALAWAFDFGPAGVVRAEGWSRGAGATPRSSALAWAGAGAIAAIVVLGGYATIAVRTTPGDAPLGAADPAPSIAVLPFVDMSAAGDQEYFADGITEEILNALAQIEELHVAARTSSFAYKGRNMPVDSIARQLGVRTVLEGSLRREGNRLRITAQLIDAGNGYHLWSENYDREVSDVFAIQDEISRAIADALRIELGIAADGVLVGASTASTEAHDLYLRGLYEWNRRGDGDLRDAVELFRQAVALDSDYVDAWVGLGSAYDLLPMYVNDIDAAESVRLARVAIERALALDPTNGRAHAVLGDLLFHYDWDVEASEREHRIAIRLSPNDATAHAWIAEPLAASGRLEEAIAHARQAVRLDPLDPKVNSDLGWMLYLDRRFEESVAQLLHTFQLDPDHRLTGVNLAFTYVRLGRLEDARASFARVANGTSVGWIRPELGERAMAGALDPARRADGLAAAREAERLGEYSPSAVYQLVLGNRDEAIRLLSEGVERRVDTMPGILMEPVFDSIREDPRFQRLVERTSRPIGTSQ